MAILIILIFFCVSESGTTDPWAQAKQEKKMRAEKNQKQQQRNLQLAAGERVPGLFFFLANLSASSLIAPFFCAGTIDLTSAVASSGGLHAKRKEKKKDKKHVDVCFLSLPFSFSILIFYFYFSVDGAERCTALDGFYGSLRQGAIQRAQDQASQGS
jgi:hypothetical protein